MIFAEWVPQFDCAFAECESFAWKQFGSSNFIKADCCQALPPRRFQIVRMVGDARRRKTASIRSRNFVGAVSANDFFDQIDIALQIAAITRNLPFGRSVLPYPLTLCLFQPEPFQNFIDSSSLDRNPQNSIAFFVAQ